METQPTSHANNERVGLMTMEKPCAQEEQRSGERAQKQSLLSSSLINYFSLLKTHNLIWKALNEKKKFNVWKYIMYLVNFEIDYLKVEMFFKKIHLNATNWYNNKY